MLTNFRKCIMFRAYFTDIFLTIPILIVLIICYFRFIKNRGHKDTDLNEMEYVELAGDDTGIHDHYNEYEQPGSDNPNVIDTRTE